MTLIDFSFAPSQLKCILLSLMPTAFHFEQELSLGRDVVSQMLARAIHAHIHGRVFTNDNKTVVFPASPGSYVSERMG